MECPRCKHSLEKGWNFCPFCGYRPGKPTQFMGGTMGGILDRLMKRLAKQMEDMDMQTRTMDRDVEIMDLSPMFRDLQNMNPEKTLKVMDKPGARGFTIRINRTNNNEPKIDVKTFGNMDESMQKQIQEQLSRMGIRQPIQPGPAPSEPASTNPKLVKNKIPKSRSRFPIPKFTEEPKTSVNRVGPKLYVDMEIPGVKKESDINVIELESSVEVRAVAGDKAFFKILTLPEQFRLEKKRFSGRTLHLEFA